MIMHSFQTRPVTDGKEHSWIIAEIEATEYFSHVRWHNHRAPVETITARLAGIIGYQCQDISRDSCKQVSYHNLATCQAFYAGKNIQGAVSTRRLGSLAT